MREVIREELGEYPETLWRHFDPEAIASASLAQVHRAEGWDGEQLAVKVCVHMQAWDEMYCVGARQEPATRKIVTGSVKACLCIRCTFICRHGDEIVVQESAAGSSEPKNSTAVVFCVYITCIYLCVCQCNNRQRYHRGGERGGSGGGEGGGAGLKGGGS